jgi:hypothetical protein
VPKALLPIFECQSLDHSWSLRLVSGEGIGRYLLINLSSAICHSVCSKEYRFVRISFTLIVSCGHWMLPLLNDDA